MLCRSPSPSNRPRLSPARCEALCRGGPHRACGWPRAPWRSGRPWPPPRGTPAGSSPRATPSGCRPVRTPSRCNRCRPRSRPGRRHVHGQRAPPKGGVRGHRRDGIPVYHVRDRRRVLPGLLGQALWRLLAAPRARAVRGHRHGAREGAARRRALRGLVCAEGAGDRGVIVYFTPTAVDGQEV